MFVTVMKGTQSVKENVNLVIYHIHTTLFSPLYNAPFKHYKWLKLLHRGLFLYVHSLGPNNSVKLVIINSLNGYHSLESKIELYFLFRHRIAAYWAMLKTHRQFMNQLFKFQMYFFQTHIRSFQHCFFH